MNGTDTAGSADLGPGVLSESSLARLQRQQDARTRHFIRGPIPMAWAERAARLPGKVLGVGLLIWFHHGIAPDRPVALTPTLLARFGIGRKAGYRAVRELEGAGLVQVERERGRSPRITVVSRAEPRKAADGGR